MIKIDISSVRGKFVYGKVRKLVDELTDPKHDLEFDSVEIKAIAMILEMELGFIMSAVKDRDYQTWRRDYCG